VLTSFKLRTVAGSTPLVFDAAITAESGAQYRVSMLRFYLSQVALLDSAGNAVPATLVDSGGKRLDYDLTFFDQAKPETQKVYLLAPKGNYRGIAFSIGVPQTTSSGQALNHTDASQQSYPLDVDNDMYWSWNSGYVFFKIEGASLVGGTWGNFVYHIGDDTHLMKLKLESPFTIAGAAEERTLLVNTNRLFVTPSGGNVPDITSGSDRYVHGGPMADSMAVNIAQSGFITLEK
jgi:hypothetical protein